MGLYDRNYGTIEEKDGRLRLSFTFPHDREGGLGIAEELVPIAWGERKYLMPAKEIVHFCNLVNEGSEPRNEIHGFCLLRYGDEKKKVTGLPAVPKQYERYLLSKPIETEIIEVGKPITDPGDGDVKGVETRITVKHGSKAGLLPGMKLNFIDPDTHDDIVLDKVEEDRSEGVLTRYQLSGWIGLLSLFDRTPKIGWKLSTQATYRAAEHKHEEDWDKIIEESSDTIRLDPKDANAFTARGCAFQQKNDFDKAIADFTEALRLDSENISLLNNMAWLLATCPKDSLRNGTKAVELAQRADKLCDGKAAAVLDTLAAAYAEAGQFPEAVETARKALELATEEKNQSLADRLRARLALYEAKKPFRDKIEEKANH
jgi:hypothetical protein